MDAMTRANGEAWDAIAKTHYENYDVQRLLSGEPLINELIKAEVGDVKGKALIHLLCHIGTDTLSWGLLGARVTGVDISSKSIEYARKIANQLKMEATFVVCDVMELAGKIEATYDIVFASTGVLCWIPDIERLANTIRSLLKPGGFFYLFDGHPFRNMLGETVNTVNSIKNDYFRRGVFEYDNFGDYVVKDFMVPMKSYEWAWTMGDVVTAFCQAGMRIAFLHEFPEYLYGGYTPYDVENNKRELYPCTFSLKAMAG